MIWTIYTNFERRLHINLALIGQAVSEIFENGGRTLTDDDDNFGFSKGKKNESSEFFSGTVAAYDDLMKIFNYSRSMSLLDFGPRS